MCQELLVDGPKEGLRRAFSPRIFADLEPHPYGLGWYMSGLRP